MNDPKSENANGGQPFAPPTLLGESASMFQHLIEQPLKLFFWLCAIWQCNLQAAVVADVGSWLGERATTVTPIGLFEPGAMPGQPHILCNLNIPIPNILNGLPMDGIKVVATRLMDALKPTAHSTAEAMLPPLAVPPKFEPVSGEQTDTTAEGSEQVWTTDNISHFMVALVIGLILGYGIDDAPNARTERRGRPSASALPTDVARPRSLQ